MQEAVDWESLSELPAYLFETKSVLIQEDPPMPHKIKLILNPIANHGRSMQLASDLRPLLAQLNADWSGTEHPGHATELARSAGGQGYDLVVAAGGDGTVHEVINGLMQVPEKERPALGIIPLGSGNDFAHILGVPGDPSQALQACLTGQARSLDMGSVRDENDRLEYFNNTLGIGFDAVVTIRTRKIISIHGFLMYFVATLQTILRNFTPMDLHVETDRESWDQATIMLTLGNGPREGGGFIVTPDAKLDDGLLHYVTIRKISRLTMLRLVPEVMKGTQARFKQVRMGTCRKMNIASRQPLYVHCDGEIYAGFGTDLHKLTIEILPGVVRVLL
jgi:YegS/Rv2252/BmrU family lipid kinase